MPEIEIEIGKIGEVKGKFGDLVGDIAKLPEINNEALNGLTEKFNKGIKDIKGIKGIKGTKGTEYAACRYIRTS